MNTGRIENACPAGRHVSVHITGVKRLRREDDGKLHQIVAVAAGVVHRGDRAFQRLLGLLGRLDRKRHGNGRAALRLRLEHDGAAVQLRDAAHERQAEADAPARVAQLGGPVETRKCSGQKIRIHALAAVAYAQKDAVAAAFEADIQRAAVGREFQGVADQMEDGLFDALAVDPAGKGLVRKRIAQRNARFAAQKGQTIEKRGEMRCQLQLFAVQTQLIAEHGAHIREAEAQAEKLIHGAVHAAHLLLQLGIFLLLKQREKR